MDAPSEAVDGSAGAAKVDADLRSPLSNNGMVAVNAAGRIVLADARMARMFGYKDAAELTGLPFGKLVPTYAAFPLLATGRVCAGRRKDGTEFSVEIGLTTSAEMVDGPVVLSSVVDVSERALERKQLSAERVAAEIAARNRLLAAMSHEIRTPLTGLVGCVDLLEAHNSGLSPTLFAAIHRSANDLLGIVNGVLELTQLEVGAVHAEQVLMKPRDVLRAVSAALWPQMREKGLGYTAIVGPNVPEAVLGDPVRLRQVLLSLVGNAVKFTE